MLVYGDYLLAHTYESVEITPIDFGPVPAKDWAVNGARGGSGRSRLVTSLGMSKQAGREVDPESHWKSVAERHKRIEAAEVRVECQFTEGAELVVVAFGTAAKFVRYVVRQMREEGVPVGCVRPITLWPFPYHALAEATKGAHRVAVFELNAGQMIDDVRLGVLGRAPVVAIGGISTDASGFGVGRLLDTEVVRERIEAALKGQEVQV